MRLPYRKERARIRAVYVTQFDGWWKLSLREWADICRSGAAGCGYLLPWSRQLKRRPATVGVTQLAGSARSMYWLRTNGYLLVQPLDWDKETFAAELAQIEARGVLA
jgi:hypothetical protein